ncbi:MAG: TonB-dependent receptor [Chitinophagales bacterium]|nr:TonB-dependent receptor [Chitinophagales bacterium]
MQNQILLPLRQLMAKIASTSHLLKTAVFIFICLTFFENVASGQSFTQSLRGSVKDVDSQEPLIGAVIRIPALNTGTTTDENGNFRLTEIPVGRYDIQFSYLGYEESTASDVMVTSGKEVILNLHLVEKVNELNEVVVRYDRTKDNTVTNNDMTTVSSRSFNIDDTKRYAGSLGDPSRMAANFAGVSGANDARNDIIIRGNSPAGLLWQLEGMNIPNPNHFGALGSTGGPVSMLNNNVLDKSDFMTSAFPAQYGNASSGVFDLRMRNGNDEQHEFLGQIGFNGFELGAEGPFAKNSNSSYLINYRYSTLGVFQQLGIDFGTGSATPDYQDLSLKLNFKVGNGNLSVFGLGGISDVSFLGNETDTAALDFYGSRYSNTIVKYKTGIAGISYEHNISPKSVSKITLGFTGTDEYFHGDSISDVTLEEFPCGNGTFKTQKYSLNYSLTHKFNAKNTLGTGITGELIYADLFNQQIHEGTIYETNISTKTNTLLTQAFAQWKHRFNEKLTFKGGTNVMLLSLNNSIALDPRIGFTYRLKGNQSLNIGYGIVSRMQPLTMYAIQTPSENGFALTNSELEFSKAHHLVLGYDWLIWENLNFKVESYYQYLYNIPVEETASAYSAINSGDSFAPDFTDSLVNNGTGYNYGLEFTLEKYFSDSYYFLATTSFFNSRYKGSDEVERNTAYNQHYVINLLAGKELLVGKKRNALGLDIKFTTAGGKYLTPIDLEASDATGSAVYLDDLAYSEQQDPYLRLDAKLYFRQNFKGMAMEFSLDLQNVTNNQNVFSQQYDPYTNTVVTEYQQGFFPVPTFKMTF